MEITLVLGAEYRILRDGTNEILTVELIGDGRNAAGNQVHFFRVKSPAEVLFDALTGEKIGVQFVSTSQRAAESFPESNRYVNLVRLTSPPSQGDEILPGEYQNLGRAVILESLDK